MDVLTKLDYSELENWQHLIFNLIKCPLVEGRMGWLGG